MRGFQCDYYIKDKNNELTKEGINKLGNFAIYNSCWSSLQQLPAGSFIYIDNYETEETKDSIDLLLKLVNEITPCSIVNIKDKDYIEYKLLEHYDQNLILLNFIRNLWNEPGIGHLEGKGAPFVPDYSTIFFDVLKKTRYKDPLKKLTHANKKASVNYKLNGYGPGHSNVQGYDELKIKDVKSLMDFKGNSTRTFLIT